MTACCSLYLMWQKIITCIELTYTAAQFRAVYSCPSYVYINGYKAEIVVLIKDFPYMVNIHGYS